jgi:2-C-methyl-D-erythritol 4-phosphate cytidylyltransferase/2-C-methyl-D-erythritol 2,4-cyclodiphosphate synthase
MGARIRADSVRITVAAVIAAGGTGTRIGSSQPKQFLPIGGRPILLRTIDSLLALENIIHVVVVLPQNHIARAEALLADQSWTVPVICVPGGATRQDSVHAGVRCIPSEADLILVHDAVRPFCDREILDRVVRAAWRTGGAVPGIPATETIQRVSGRGRVLKTPPREQLYAIQTPQCFRAPVLRSALELAFHEGFSGTDESSVVCRAKQPVAVVEGSQDNIKITRVLDLDLAERILARREAEGRGFEDGQAAPTIKRPKAGEIEMLRIGHGMDYHRLVQNRRLVLGGVEIPFEKGLEGHSDADALSHAVCDALLGAAALGDIGSHFPDHDPMHKDRSSLDFLSEVRDRIGRAGWRILNVDATLLAQRPKLSPFFESMRLNLSRVLALPAAAISIKATTTEGMNAEGCGEGISAHAVALLRGEDYQDAGGRTSI